MEVRRKSSVLRYRQWSQYASSNADPAASPHPLRGAHRKSSSQGCVEEDCVHLCGAIRAEGRRDFLQVSHNFAMSEQIGENSSAKYLFSFQAKQPRA